MKGMREMDTHGRPAFMEQKGKAIGQGVEASKSENTVLGNAYPFGPPGLSSPVAATPNCNSQQTLMIASAEP